MNADYEELGRRRPDDIPRRPYYFEDGRLYYFEDDAGEDLAEALELLGLWFDRWRGYVAGTPDGLISRTTTLLRMYRTSLRKPLQ